MEIKLDGPKTVTLSPNTIAFFLDAGAEKPFKAAAGPMQELFAQLKQEEKIAGNQEEKVV